MVSILSFDIGGTLLKGNEQGFCSFLCNSLGFTVESIRSLLEQYFLTSSKTISQSLSGFYDELGIPLSERKYPENDNQPSKLFDDVLANLRLASDKGFRLISLSNCTQWEAEKPLPVKLDDLLETSFRSFEIGWAKPNVEAFEWVEASLGLDSKEFIHIGDSWKAEVVGALTSGWKAIYLDRQSSKPCYFSQNGVPVINSLYHLIPVLENYEWM